jgi:NAD(P)H-nitrite reductase large subunit
VPGFGAEYFVLREAEDAMEIRAYAQRQRCRQAVVAAAAAGVEAAYALHKPAERLYWARRMAAPNWPTAVISCARFRARLISGVVE